MKELFEEGYPSSSDADAPKLGGRAKKLVEAYPALVASHRRGERGGEAWQTFFTLSDSLPPVRRSAAWAAIRANLEKEGEANNG